MNKVSIILIFILSVFSRFSVLSQSSVGTISGKVVDSNGELIPFAYIVLTGTGIGTTTDEYGVYIIKNIPEGIYTIESKYLGYHSQVKEIKITSNKSQYQLNFKLTRNTEELDEVQVVGKTEATLAREKPFAITSIDVKPMQNLNLDVNQVLANTTGVRIRENGGLGSSFDFSLNGFNGNQVRFFIDGIPMENFGSSLTLNNLPVNIAQRIEVYKGVVPVDLGSDALGGAVNIVTNKDNKTYLDASYSYGSFNTHRSSISGGFTDDKTGFRVKANLFQNYSDNSYQVLVNKKEGSVILKEKEKVERFHDSYQSKSGIIDVGFVNKSFADQLLFGFVLSKSEKDQQTGATMEKVYGQRKRINSTVMPTLKYKKSDLLTEGLDLNIFASYNMGYSQIIDTVSRTYFWDGSYVEKADPTDGELNRTLYRFTDNAMISRANLSYEMNDMHSFVMNLTTNSVNRKGDDEANPFEISNQEPKIVSKSVLGLGYNFDWNERIVANIFGKYYGLDGFTHYTENIYNNPERVRRNLEQSQYGYGMALVYRIPTLNLQLKASSEKAYRMPEAFELFGDGANLQGNVLLEPEASTNYNIGALYDREINQYHILNFEINFLNRDVEQFIRPSVGSSNPTSSFVNEDAVKVLGVEGGVRYKYKRLLRIAANATYQVQRNDVAYIDGKSNPLYKKQIPNQPYLFANANAMLNFDNVYFKADRLGLGYNASFFEEYYLFWSGHGSKDSKKLIPSQFTHNLDVNYSLKNGKYNLSLACRNIFDAELYDNFKLQKPGRSFSIKVRYFFAKN